ncbi:MAG TPA: prepilin-type N-terminal cleavage/methylation domain-containing protein [Chthoniobacteraceae bacterium]|nr:prepilin-type N-terminal cleavage/methylation domain-containing protein [Chthoniobacteraceae bacterium]
MKRESGFTLTEMMVALVLLLALSMLVSYGAQRLRANANQSLCLTNLRNLSSGLYSHAADHNGSLMPRVAGSLVPWPPVIDAYLGGNGLSFNAHTITSRTWACPENKTLVNAFQRNGRAEAFNTGYPINRHLTKSSDGFTYGIPMAQVRQPAQKVYVIESCRLSDGAFGPATTMAYTPYGYSGWMKQVHPRGNHVLFCDGHVEPVAASHELCSKTVSVSGPWWLP